MSIEHEEISLLGKKKRKAKKGQLYDIRNPGVALSDPPKSSKKGSSILNIMAIIIFILLMVIAFFVGLFYIFVPVYVVGVVVALVWQLMFNRNRSWKDKAYVSLYSWLFVF